MANNCLVTKLKGTVNDTSLRKLGEIALKIINVDRVEGDSREMPLITINRLSTSTEPLTVRTSDNVKFGINNSYGTLYTEVEINGNALINVQLATNYLMFIKDLTKIAGIRARANTGIDYLADTSEFIGLSQLAVLSNLLITGDVANMKDLSTLRTWSVPRSYDGLYGDPIYLANLISLTAYNAFVEPTVKRDIEDYITASIANGRTVTDPFYISGVFKVFTVGGVYRTDVYNNNFDGFLHYDSASKYVIYNASSSAAAAIKVFVKGYGSQSEAEAAFPGKTVVRLDA